MSITGALSNALSGLSAASRAAHNVSSNLANSMTEGYGRRELSLSARTTSSVGGVQVNGVIRIVDQEVIGERRLADADLAHSETISEFWVSLEASVGSPDDGHSLSARLAELEQSLVLSASRPDSQERLKMVATRADQVAKKLNGISDGIQKMRTRADSGIATEVDRLNTYLQQVRDLNTRISSTLNHGNEVAGLMDQRQVVIDKIGQIVPVREAPRDRDTVALFTTGGAILLDGTAAEIGFTPTPMIMPHMTRDNGLLPGITINGREVATDSESSPIRGGSLGALFQVRDELAVEAQTQLDALSRDLVERLQDPAADPSLGPTDAGLFTDNGAAFDGSGEIGLSGRLKINDLVDLSAGGDATRLRDGLAAVASRDVGDATVLEAMSAALASLRVPASGGFGPGAQTASSLTAQLVTQFGNARELGDQAQSFAASRQNEIHQMELQNGVDSDQELQRLMVIERTYAANARVIQTVDGLIEQLLRI